MSITEPINKHASDEIPLYRRIQNDIRERVGRGEWASGEMLPSRRSLCSEFSTTQVTLDKAIQGLIREGVLRASRGSGTFVTSTPRAPKTLRIGVVIKRDSVRETLEEHWDDNFYFGPLFGGIRNAVDGQAVEVKYAHLQRGDYGRYFKEFGLDGMILVLPPLEDLPALRELHDSGVPFVATGFSTGSHGDSSIPCVDVDNRGGASEAVKHLLGLGHTRIAIVNLALSHANHHDRMEGYRRTMAEAGVPLNADDLVLYPTYNANRFEPQIDEWLGRLGGSYPTAIFACDYLMTLATLRVLRKRGIRVPEDISLVSFDDPLSAADLTPPLTTVRQPVGQLGRLAARRLLGALNGVASELPLRGLEMLPTKLIVRESTAKPRAISSILCATEA